MYRTSVPPGRRCFFFLDMLPFSCSRPVDGSETSTGLVVCPSIRLRLFSLCPPVSFPPTALGQVEERRSSCVDCLRSRWAMLRAARASCCTTAGASAAQPSGRSACSVLVCFPYLVLGHLRYDYIPRQVLPFSQ